MKNLFVKNGLLTATAMLTLFVGCAPQPPVDVAPQVETADNVSYSQPTQPPPKDQKDRKPAAPGSQALWWFIPGHWVWRGKYEWVQGHWRPRPHPGDIWISGKWVRQGSVYVWQGGHWRSGAPDDAESSD